MREAAIKSNVRATGTMIEESLKRRHKVKTYIKYRQRNVANMTVVNATEARRSLFNMINLALENERVIITSKKGNVVLMSEGELNSLLETISLLSDPETIPAMKEVLETPPSEREVWHYPKEIS